MKTPEEIKVGLECCLTGNCTDCPYRKLYRVFRCKTERTRDAIGYIRKLEEDNAQKDRCIENLTDKLNAAYEEAAKFKAERDAAASELIGTCQVCRWEDTEKCADCHFNTEAWNVHESKWEWRGVQKEEKKDDGDSPD